MVYDKYETVIGLEIHAQLQTQSKIFAPDSASFGAAPNTQISFITLGHPGTLPKVNYKVIEFAIKIGLATNGEIEKRNEFSRKNYFYADLPKGYQITQFSSPISMGGHLDIKLGEESRTINLHHIHLEEDAGKSTHDQDPKHSLIDLNRAGVPLVEIVTEPELRSAEEAYQFVSEMRRLVQYLGICDGNMEEGSLRCDANVSVRLKGATKLGERTEIKNLNSLRFLKKAIEYEAKRQIDVLEAGGKIIMQTRKYDADRDLTFSLRGKEMAHDYRYFPEPDLPPVMVTDEWIEEIKAMMPELPEALRAKYKKDYQLSEYNALILTDDKETSDFYNALVTHTDKYTVAANWLIGPIKTWQKKQQAKLTHFPIPLNKLVKVFDLVADGKVSHTAASQQLFPAMLEQPEKDAAALAQEMNLIMESDDNFLQELIDNALAKFPDKVTAYKKGKKGVVGLFMGDVMKQSKGKADPKVARKLLIEKLEN